MYHKIINLSKEILSKIKFNKAINTKKIDADDIIQEDYAQNQKSKQALELYLKSQKDSNVTNVVISEISVFSALKIIGVLIAFFLFWQFVLQISEILTSLFFSIFLASVLYPLVAFFENKKIPSIASIILSFFTVFIFLFLLVSSVLPAVIDQSITFGNWLLEYTKLIYNGDFSSLPTFLLDFGPWMQEKLHNLDEYLKKLGGDTQTQSGLFQFITENISKFKPWQEGIFEAVSSIFSSLFSFVLIIILTFFLLLERNKTYQYFLSFFY